MIGNILAGLVGLAVGSFLNVIITRLSQDEPFWAGRPGCPHCHHPLPWDNLLFLLSLPWRRGRCRSCGEFLSWRYPGVEMAAGVLALGLWWRFPGSALLWAYGPFAAALLVLTVLDLQYYWLPDVITLPGTLLGLIGALILPQPGLGSALLGAFLGWAFFIAVRGVYEKVTRGRRQGVGQGDAKLMAFIGAVLGLKALPWVLFSSAFLGSLAGLVVSLGRARDRFTPIPYGPFLVAGTLVFLFWKM
jgi:leader peptidase (prepilin peptidase) / N-methyltransferase